MSKSSSGRHRWLALLTVALLALSGCGVPDSGPAVRYGKARSDSGSDGEAVFVPPKPAVARDPVELVQGYLQAANGTAENMREQVKEYFTELGKGTWQQGSGNPLVIHGALKLDFKTVVDYPRAKVTLTGDIIGSLNGGYLDRSQAQAGYSYSFNLISERRGGRQQWVIANPPPGMLLSVDSMLHGYELRPVYFLASGDRQTLVPDMRYMPKSVSRTTCNQLLVNWLLGGPSPYVSGAVNSALPVGTELRGVPVMSSGVTVVNLSSKADLPDVFDAMSAQLAWTLQAGSLELRVDGRPKPFRGAKVREYDGFKDWNPAVTRPVPQPFAIAQGKVVPVRRPEQESEPVVPALLSHMPVDDVRWAATLFGKAAVVSASGELWVGRATQAGDPQYGVAQQIKQAPTSPPQLIQAGGSTQVLVGIGPSLAIVDAVRLGLDAIEVAGTYPGSGDITSVSIAPDGRRIVFVRAGQVYAGVLSGNNLLRAWPIAAPLSYVASVAWDSELCVIVSGIGRSTADGTPATSLWRATFDGMLIEAVGGQLTGAPGVVAAFVPPPGMGCDPLVEIEGRVYSVRSSGNVTHGSAPFYAG
ncbi:MAG: GerMN domain-containing protein [Longispora sp.]|nr:GerMN domain-containing protein [Longispora sp. (in: high G+C Gram-positive bacteria)]